MPALSARVTGDKIQRASGNQVIGLCSSKAGTVEKFSALGSSVVIGYQDFALVGVLARFHALDHAIKAILLNLLH